MTAAVVVALSVCSPATANAQLPGSDSPAVNQYVESVPTGPGRTVPSGTPPRKAATLPAETRRRLREQAGTSARALENLATDPSLGAPAGGPGKRAGVAPERRGGKRPARRGTAAAPAPDVGVASAAAGALAASSLGTAAVALVLLLVAVALIAGPAARRARRNVR